MEPMVMYNACVEALETYVRRAGFTDVVIGLSGGMDSSLVAVMAVDAFGAASVHGAARALFQRIVSDRRRRTCSQSGHRGVHGVYLQAL